MLWSFLVLEWETCTRELLLFRKLFFFLTFRVNSGTVVTSNLLAPAKNYANIFGESFLEGKGFCKNILNNVNFLGNLNFLKREISQIFAKICRFSPNWRFLRKLKKPFSYKPYAKVYMLASLNVHCRYTYKYVENTRLCHQSL